MKANSVLDTIGGTPHIRFSRLFPDATVWIKSERANPGGSIKDRIGLSMIEAAEASGALKPGGTIIEPTSGNTGIGLAMVAAVKGYKLILVMPESMSIERRRLMQAYGATFDLTPREKGMKGAIERASELRGAKSRRLDPAAIRQPGQHRDPQARDGAGDPCRFPRRVRRAHHRRRHRRPHHRLRRGAEAALAEAEGVRGRADGLAGDLGRRPGPHPIQGIGAGFIPANLHTAVLDGVIQVEAEEAREYARRSAREEGLLVGISSGATLAAIAKKLPELPQGATRARVQLRHRRALPVGAGFSANVSVAARKFARRRFALLYTPLSSAPGSGEGPPEADHHDFLSPFR